MRPIRPLFWIAPLALLLAACAPPPPLPGFALGLSATELAATPGGSATTTLTVTPDAGFSGDVALALLDTENEPVPGLAVAPSTVTVPPLTTAQGAVEQELTLTVGAGIATDAYALRLTASADGRSRSLELTLTVADVLEPVVTVTSPADATVVTGSREVTVAGTLSGVSEIVDVRVSGVGSVLDVVFDQASFSATVALGDNLNDLVVTAEDDDGRTGEGAVALAYPFLAFADFASASAVVGQPDFEGFEANQGDAATAETFYLPSGVHVTETGALYVSDATNDRVLRFPELPTENGATADLVLGQPDFTTTVEGFDRSGLNAPQEVFGSGELLAVADGAMNRVLIWNSPPGANRALPDVVVGQPDFLEAFPFCSDSGIDAPADGVVVDGKLIVVSQSQSRVLIWNEVPTVNGAPADIVLGQGSFDTCIWNDDDQDATTDGVASDRTLYFPTSVWSDGERVAIADSFNNRVLIWTTFPTASFAPADVVIGQPDFVARSFGAGSTRLASPQGVTSNGNQLFIADTGNDRVLIYDLFPTENGQPADRVLGQSNFTNAEPNDDDQDGVPDGPPSARTFSNPTGLTVADDRLIVADLSNHRVLVFEAP